MSLKNQDLGINLKVRRLEKLPELVYEAVLSFLFTHPFPGILIDLSLPYLSMRRPRSVTNRSMKSSLKTQNLDISCCCFVQDSQEMNQDI